MNRGEGALDLFPLFRVHEQPRTTGEGDDSRSVTGDSKARFSLPTIAVRRNHAWCDCAAYDGTFSEQNRPVLVSDVAVVSGVLG